MFLEKLCKHNEILKHLIDNIQKLWSLNQKHDWTEFLNVMNSNSSITKQQIIFKLTLHMILYKTTDYLIFYQFISQIESNMKVCQMNDFETVIYAITELEYSEKKLWKLHIKNSLMKKIWKKMISFLFFHMKNLTNQIHNVWQTLFYLRKKENKNHY